MAEQKLIAGMIVWTDLTVDDAPAIRDFYRSVIGWDSSSVDMGGYNDFNMIPPGLADGVAGICHARGSNAGLPPQWLIYIVVEDVDRSAARCRELGGELVVEPRPMAGGRFAVIRDPAGAVCAIFRPPQRS